MATSIQRCGLPPIWERRVSGISIFFHHMLLPLISSNQWLVFIRWHLICCTQTSGNRHKWIHCSDGQHVAANQLENHYSFFIICYLRGFATFCELQRLLLWNQEQRKETFFLYYELLLLYIHNCPYCTRSLIEAQVVTNRYFSFLPHVRNTQDYMQ